MCSDFFFNEELLAKKFPQSLKDTALEWFFSLPPNSINSFSQLVDQFLQHFQAIIGPIVSLIDLVHCKQGSKEKLTEFIGRYQGLISQIQYPIKDEDLYKVFIINLQLNICDKILLMKYSSFQHLCITL